jgi:hypothetical protein
MTFATDINSDLSVFFNTDEFAEEVTYAGTDINALIYYGERLDERSGALVSTCTLSIQVSDVTTPAYRDTVVIGSATWTVTKINNGDANIWEITAEKDERPRW